jgi:hypothetical protein
MFADPACAYLLEKGRPQKITKSHKKPRTQIDNGIGLTEPEQAGDRKTKGSRHI